LNITSSNFYFDKPFKNDNYVVLCNADGAASGGPIVDHGSSSRNFTQADYYDNVPALATPNGIWFLAWFGELADEGDE